MPDPSSLPASAIVTLRGITKTFPGVVANDRIDLDLYPHEIHALLGENGAGKSTLMKVLYGFYRADAGRMTMEGRPLDLRSPRDARAAGIGMVFQDFTLIPAFTVAENIALFLRDLPPILDPRDIHRRILELAGRYSLAVEPEARVSDLSIGEQQKVEILKLLLSEARLLILDEPTRVLAPHEVVALLEVLKNLRADGFAIVLITHKLREVLECADRITVLRRGRVSGTLTRGQAEEDGLIRLMFGQELPSLSVEERPAPDRTRTALEIREVRTRGEGAETALVGVSFEIHPGEILGVAGVSGNGQRELADTVLGMRACETGTKLVFGQDATGDTVRTIRDRGVCFIPENPLAMASVPFMTVLENMALTRTREYSRRGGLSMNWPAVRLDFERSCADLGFRLPAHSLARSLSGGNLQRMVIAREMGRRPRVIIASYLTRGLDAQSTVAARSALLQARRNGAAVLLISEDLEEIFALCDRLVILRGGRIVASFQPKETDLFTVGRYMTGAEVQHAI